MALEVFAGYSRTLNAIGRSSTGLNPLTVRTVQIEPAAIVLTQRVIGYATSEVSARPGAGFIYPRRNC